MRSPRHDRLRSTPGGHCGDWEKLPAQARSDRLATWRSLRIGSTDRPADRQRLAGQVPDGATRLVSLHDPDARPIRKGRLGKPVEFGYKAQVVDNEDGVVIDHNVEIGNPADAPMLVPAIERVTRRAKRVPKAVTADRGYGETAVGEQLSALGRAQLSCLPTKGKPSASRRAVRVDRSSKRW